MRAISDGKQKQDVTIQGGKLADSDVELGEYGWNVAGVVLGEKLECEGVSRGEKLECGGLCAVQREEMCSRCVGHTALHPRIISSKFVHVNHKDRHKLQPQTRKVLNLCAARKAVPLTYVRRKRRRNS
jgi:hypothetical protein